jgi:hypothetical protein
MNRTVTNESHATGIVSRVESLDWTQNRGAI